MKSILNNRIIISIFVIAFLVIQSYPPTRYYYNKHQQQQQQQQSPSLTQEEEDTIDSISLESLLATDDERFVWRMFSPTAIETKCRVNYYYQNDLSKNIHYIQRHGPIYWNQVGVSTLVLFRFLFFSLMAIDFWNELPRAANYWRGISEFNVPHFTSSSSSTLLYLTNHLPLINDTTFIICAITALFLSVRCAFGFVCTTRFECLFIATIKAWMVLSSQTDNYQHHYLLVLVLFILSTLSFNFNNDKEKNNIIQCPWQIRLLFIQLSIVYFWTSVAKLNESWIDGSVLPRMVGPEFKETLASVLGTISPILADNSMAILSVSTLVAELFLVFALHIPFLYPIVSFTGISMHVLMGSSGLRIGTFSYFMTLFYVFTLPRQFSDLLVGFGLKVYNTIIQLVNLVSIPRNIVSSLFITIGSVGLIYQFIPDPYTNLFISSLVVVIVYSFITSLPLFNNNSEKSYYSSTLFTQCIFTFMTILFILYLSISTPHLRKIYQEKGSIAFSASNYQLAIDNYLIAERLGDREIKGGIGRLVAMDGNEEFEFVGDLGLFLEHFNRWNEAHNLYTKYAQQYPSQLKFQAGLIRYYNQHGQTKELCATIPTVIELAQNELSQQCHSVACSRSKGHAKYVLQIAQSLANNNKCHN
ncbi:hypothetical protein DFA_00244 [Cavenderia fasciculata]|uniref:HTTM-like domain-containing protein n=1 Tax=Cavenderia fasciculata TaxID=261658 RepID=F4PY06_CACFS|nr:uncharacterized protein DFA_00244 [Cavenderia fasciculata]EGG19666.1 hypothetical protein DFA_00244 [Cavenderia fasciculata]|eukprot:XP_004357960.1 hypothetical protein DFA_00244 [Cavenderia fasciculata]